MRTRPSRSGHPGPGSGGCFDGTRAARAPEGAYDPAVRRLLAALTDQPFRV
ncbi:hypothetical protein [Streptomyces sp. NPDC008137]|uniref:hypothetical protein n=1 Tax=Streptomyces sp. NPDC008137 TaxID=3364813 RepID=UPI0036ED5946